MKNRLLIAVSVAALLIGVGLVRAQVVPPQLPTIAAVTDRIQDIPNGQPSAQSFYVAPAQISNAPQYVKALSQGVAAQGVGYFNYFAQAQTYLIVVLTATMPYTYAYTAVAPSDGARECVSGSGGAITSLYFTASSGQTVTGGSNVSVSSNSSACWTYSASNLTWDRS
jgi:hypothetical protein